MRAISVRHKRCLSTRKRATRTTFIVATEAGILHTMRKASPDKTFIAAAPEFEEDGDVTCGCSTCPHMKLNTLEKVYLCLRDLSPEVEIAAPLRERALAPIERMLGVA